MQMTNKMLQLCKQILFAILRVSRRLSETYGEFRETAGCNTTVMDNEK